MKKILITGGSHSDIPLIVAAKRLGFHVTTGGNRPSDIGHSYSDSFEYFDYSNSAELQKAAVKIGADAICACCNDFAAISCSIVAQNLGLPGYDAPWVSRTIHHKDLWRAFARQHGLSTPVAVGCETPDQVERAVAALGFPLIVKPVDLTGGKGIRRANSFREATEAAKEALAVSRVKRVVVEQFVVGSRHGFSCYLLKRKVAFFFIDDEVYHLSEYLVAAAYTPASCPESSIPTLISEVERVAEILNLVDGIFHVQFIQREDGSPVIIEACRRCPGDLYVELVRHATGLPYAEYIVASIAGVAMPPLSQPKGIRCVTRHCLMSFKKGVFLDLQIAPSVASRVIDQLLWSKPGEAVADPQTHKFGIVFIEHANIQQMREEAPRLQRLCHVNVI